MKKYVIIVGLVLIILVGAAVAYYFYQQEPSKPPRYKRDPNAWLVPPVLYPMKGKNFVVPEQDNQSVKLDLISASAKHDYPMGRFETSSTTGTLTALDDLASSIENGSQVVPIVVSVGDDMDNYYLAVIEKADSEFLHTTSIYLGERLRLTRLSKTDTQVTIDYLIHDRTQAPTENPSVSTTAIIDISTGTFVQEGRKPWLEANLVLKEFKGKYMWVQTMDKNGDVVKPSKSDIFALYFDGPRVSLTTDCNTGSSEFAAPAGTSTTMSFGPVASTKMFCQSNEEGPYFRMIEAVVSYVENEAAGTITFTLADGREMLFVKEGQTLEFEASEESVTSSTE